MAGKDKTEVKLTRFTAKELAERNRLAGLDAQEPAAHVYSEEELDELYETDPVAAMRISREQEMAKRRTAQVKPDPNAPAPDRAKMVEVLEEARRILLQDGGDLELMEIQGNIVRVRLKGACVGCPNAVLDLKQVVEKIVRRHFPEVAEVQNTF